MLLDGVYECQIHAVAAVAGVSNQLMYWLMFMDGSMVFVKYAMMAEIAQHFGVDIHDPETLTTLHGRQLRFVVENKLLTVLLGA